ncbi:cyclic nucleotide-binding/CBS domain-containing protein [Thermoplasma sp.]|uniref:CBS domain-containing protein n=1 Tax=Thermoplasma sp. TaxID=1973142 RepID=UPI00128736E1|nr:CBS domain-containing protein [Thermoplasma sp.]KAA8923503.1 MAG: CBS domain-containing protein [Thermoplasma sp.]
MVLYASDVMRKYDKVMAGETSAYEAAKIMAQDHVGFAIVAENGEIRGMVTEWDYINKIIAQDRDPRKVRIDEIMNSPIISIDPDTPTFKVTEIMAKNGIRRLPVMKNGKLLGVITSRDILRIFKDYMDSISDIISRFGNL